MSKIRQSARGETCTFQLFGGACNGDPETVVLCHAPHPDKGTGIKGPDTWAAYGCWKCHSVMDNRGHPFWSMQLDDQEYEKHWYYAIRETQRRLIKKKLLVEA